MLPFLSNPLLSIALVMALVAGGFGAFEYHQSVVANFEKNETIYQANAQKDKEAIESRDKQIESLKIINTQIIAENKAAQDSNLSAQKKINDIHDAILNPKRQKTLATIRENPKVAPLLVDKLNSSAACEITHINDYDGKCTNGTWKVN